VDAIGLLALAGLAFALVVHGAFLVLASLAGAQRSLAYPALVIASASLLAWQGLVEATWLPAAVAVLLLSAAVGVLAARRPRPRLPSLARVEWLALLLLATAALYGASLPLTAAMALFVAKERKRISENVRVFFLFVRRRQVREYLRLKRQELEIEVAQMVRLARQGG